MTLVETLKGIESVADFFAYRPQVIKALRNESLVAQVRRSTISQFWNLKNRIIADLEGV